MKKNLSLAKDIIFIGLGFTLFFGTCFNKNGTIKENFSKPDIQIENALITKSMDIDKIRISKEHYINNNKLKEHYVISSDDLNNYSMLEHKVFTPKDASYSLQEDIYDVEKSVMYYPNKDYKGKISYTKIMPKVYLKSKE
jgi:hypothetical protein